MFPFDDVVVTEGPGARLAAKSTPSGAMATLVTAKRAVQALKARLDVAAESGAGESRPVRTGTSEAYHQANGRIEVRIRS